MNWEYDESANDSVEYAESANDSAITACFCELGIHGKRKRLYKYGIITWEYVNSEYMESTNDCVSTLISKTALIPALAVRVQAVIV